MLIRLTNLRVMHYKIFFFVPKVNVVAERNKFCQYAQQPGKSTVQYVAALRDLLVNCDFGILMDDMIRDQIVEKTCTPHI